MELSITEITIRMFLAMIIGTIVGFERTKASKPAGIRTHSLVCIAFSMLTITSVYGFSDIGKITDPARLVSQAVTGIGFLGAGIIWKHNDEIRGLTTATNVWAVAGLGIVVGLGHYYLVFITVLLMFLALKMAKILHYIGMLRFKRR